MTTAILLFIASALVLGCIRYPKLQVVKKENLELDEVDWMRGLIDALRAGATPSEALGYGNHRIIPTTSKKLNQPTEIVLALRADANQSNSLLLKALAACWQVSQQHGAPLAPALQSALDAQLDRIAIADEIKSQLAGPRTAALTLALLPFATLLFAQSLGISAVSWLITSWFGFAVLILGIALLGTGTLIMFRLTNAIERELRM
jgi:tight adherence protein B